MILRNLCLSLTVAFSLTTLPTVTTTAWAQDLEAATQAKLTERLKMVKEIAAHPAIVAAVKERNAATPPEYKALTQDAWKSLPITDPKIRGLTKNPAGEYLKSKKATDKAIEEMFLSAADGTKVALLAKTTSWSHKGSAKHDQPMEGKDWQGKPELDESTGKQLVQVSVPVLDGGKSIGSLVVGFSTSALK